MRSIEPNGSNHSVKSDSVTGNGKFSTYTFRGNRVASVVVLVLVLVLEELRCELDSMDGTDRRVAVDDGGVEKAEGEDETRGYIFHVE